MIQAVSHIIADDPADGIEAIAGHLRTSPLLAASASCRIVRQSRGRLEPPRLQADIIVSHLPVTWRNFAYLTALRALHPSTPLVHVEHALGDAYVAGTVTDRDRFEALVAASYALFDRIVALNPAQQHWIERHRFVSAGRVVVIEPCADLAPLATTERCAPGSITRLAAVGTFDHQSGLDILIDAIIALDRRDITLRLVGDGPRHREIVARAKGHPAIEFADPPADIGTVFAEADALVIPARWEASSLRALQAMAAGVPVFTAPTDAARGLAGAGVVVLAENTSRGWRELLEHCDRRTVDIGSGRRHAATAEAKFAAAWRGLVDELVQAGSADTRSAA